jgi:membrane-bound lytic murein transglycosylase D
MTKRTWLQTAAAIGVGLSVAGCGSSLKTVQPTVTPAPAPPSVVAEAPAPPPVQDPVVLLIAQSQQFFADGERERSLGHLEQAKTNFDNAIDVLLKSPYGARSEPRIRQHFDLLVERISASEITALAQGDGFVEKTSEPASIDDLLAMSTFESLTPTAELQSAVESDLSLRRHDIEIPLNNRVLSYINLFQGNLREFIDEGLRRGSRYLPMIQDEFKKAGLPLDLAYVPLVESAFKTNAQSRAKARGMWQFMRSTGLEHGLRQNWYVDERSDPEKATQAAAKYLKTLAGMFDGDWHLALASYNGGPGRVQRAMRRGRKSDFWELSKAPRLLPRETREYVPMILAAMVIARNPAQYGFSPIPDQPLSYERVTVKDPVDLRRVAEWTGTPIDEIESLNPELRRWTTPVRTPAYEVKVPVGTGDAFRARLAEVTPEALAAFQWHTVKRGESLLSIARKLKVKQADLAEANYLSVRARVSAGQQLIIPRAPTTLMAASVDNPAPAAQLAESRPVVSQAAALTTPPTGVPVESQRLIYRVKRGDTLFSIARLYHTTVDALRSWNTRTVHGNRINVGDRLTIFASRTAN